jgi:hypothetical protein
MACFQRSVIPHPSPPGAIFGESVPILYDVQTGTVMRGVDFDAALKAYFGKHCSIHPAIESLGFSPYIPQVSGIRTVFWITIVS